MKIAHEYLIQTVVISTWYLSQNRILKIKRTRHPLNSPNGCYT